MLPLLLNVPTDDAESWNRYSFNLRFEVDRINEAILSQKRVSLPSYQLDPIPQDVKFWLQNVSQALGGITTALSIQSVDILDVDLTNESARAGWVYEIWQELTSAEAVLQI
jgi:hypothetical protein